MASEKCGAKRKSDGKPCTQPAGWGTDHFGVGRCRFHGGCTPIKHGRYSTVKGPLAEKMSKHETDPDPANLIPELSVLRALLEGFLGKYEETPEVLIGGAEKLIDGIRKTVDTIHKMQTRDLLTSRELEAAAAQIVLIVQEEVKDPDVLRRISTRLSTALFLPSLDRITTQ